MIVFLYNKSTNYVSYFLMGFFLILFSVTVFSQDSPFEKKITIHLKEVPLSLAIEEISRVSGIKFSYSKDLIPAQQPVSIEAKNKSINKVLDDLFSSLPLDYQLIEGYIVIQPSKDTKQESPQKKYTISGYLTDESTKEALIGAAIYVQPDLKGTVSNEYGFYSLSLPSGNYELNITFLGYQTFAENIKLVGDIRLNKNMMPEEATIPEIVIELDQQEVNLQATQMSESKINQHNIEKMPAFLGEFDVIKSLYTIPGITPYSEGSSFFHVRGGNRDQNLILLDEAPVYMPSHMLGIITPLIPEVINDITVYKGDIPARYGGRLSSLVNIHTNNGDLNNFSGTTSIGLLSARTSVQGPIRENKSSIFLAARHSYFGWLLKNVNKNLDELYFYDLMAKLNYIISDKDRLYISIYTGKDRFESATNDYLGWTNTTASLRWNHLFDDKLFSNFTLALSNYNYNQSATDTLFWDSQVGSIIVKGDFTYYITPHLTMNFGTDLSVYNTNPGNLKSTESKYEQIFVPKRSRSELSSYISFDHKISSWLELRYGLRTSVSNNLGETTVFRFDESGIPYDTLQYAKGEAYNPKGSIEPRLGINIGLSKRLHLKASYARTTQQINLISNYISPFNTMEIWLPADINIPIQKADQWATGLYKYFPAYNIKLGGELFYKIMTNQIMYANHANLLLNPLLENELVFGKSKAYGIEFSAEQSAEKYSWYVAYTYSRVLNQVEDLNNNKPFRAYYDRPNDFNIHASYNFTKKITLAFNWIYHSGSVATIPTEYYGYQGYRIPYYADIANYRLPDYHRLDVALDFKFGKPNGLFSHKLNFSIYNLYYRKNPYAMGFNKIELDDSFQIPANLNSEYFLVPTYRFIYGIIPSINYTITL